ncbi:sensor histidine kinase [Silvibacterium bohemicum]|uniref:sensor histidine kinase n=1 Tax=Silvibacterium bohemicum TaxID=1577686 RepID=UPI0006798C49|nr:sensor histidine kinase [Silvibacterium bohemicum]
MRANRLLILAALGWLMLATTPAYALNPSRQLSQYAHTSWRISDGEFSGIPTVMTQTADGYLWLGTNIGLLRFDGNRFLPWSLPPGQRLADSRIFSIGGAKDGSLWIGSGYSVSHWANGTLTTYAHPQGRIESMYMDRKDAAWIVRTQATDRQGPLCRMTSGGFRCLGPADGVPYDSALAVTADTSGNLWIGGYYGLCRWKDETSICYFHRSDKEEQGVGSVRAIAASPDGSLWANIETSSTKLELEQFQNGQWIRHIYPSIPANNADVITLFVDRENFLWVGTAHHGVFRIQGSRVEHFGSEYGLSSDAIGSFYEDREGTMWVVTSGGVDNFRDVRVASYSMREGMYADGASSLIARRDGTVWVGNFQSINFLRDGKLSSIREYHDLPGRSVTTLFEDHAGRLWVGIDNGLWVYENNRFRAILDADNQPIGIVFSICEDADHSLWVKAGPHLYHIRDFQIEEEKTSFEIAHSYILAAHPAGGAILGTVTGNLVRYNNGREEILPVSDGKKKIWPSEEEDNLRHIRDLQALPDGSIWGTTVSEFFIWKDGVRENLTAANGLPCTDVFAFLRDSRGSLWLSMSCGLVHISSSEVARWWKHPEAIIHAPLVVGTLDGVQPGVTSLKPQMAMTPDHKIWVVNSRILQMYDPDDERRNEVPPPIHIEQIVADRTIYAPQQNLHLPPHTKDLQIDYAALSFVVPKKVRYRYKLEGRDHDWQDPDIRRQALYSDLSPGNYRFRLIACNNDGLWNEAEASWNFVVEPAYYQTEWFRVMCTVLALMSLWLLHRLRMWRMRESINARFDERMAERTRLARELHDTLLQTIQGSKMVADDALENPGDNEHMRHALQRLSRWLDKAMEEGRAALNSLRTSTIQVNDLAPAFERAARECSDGSSMEFTLLVDGVAREMHPIVRDEVYRIGYEAIRNACTHSGGSRVEVDLSYTRDLVLRVRDDGKGIHPEIAASGKNGHFGLKGMHERALRVGGALTLSSSAYSGTEVELIVPGDVVFYNAGTQRPSISAMLRSIFRPRPSSPNK